MNLYKWDAERDPEELRRSLERTEANLRNLRALVVRFLKKKASFADLRAEVE